MYQLSRLMGRGRREGRQKGVKKPAKACRTKFHYMAYLFSNKKEMKGHFREAGVEKSGQ